jgi:membrane protein
MLGLRRSIWNHLFGSDETAGKGLPRWLLPPIRFAYLISQEFSRNRCQEKASALGFQTVFSLIPAVALALFFFRAFGDFSDLGGKVEPVLYKILKIDRIYLSQEESPKGTDQARPAKIPENDRAAPAVPSDGTPEAAEASRLDTKIQELVDSVYLKLSTGGLNIVSFAWLVVAALSLALTIEKSLNEIWGFVGERRLLRRIAIYWSMLTLGPLLIGLSIYATRQVGVDSAIQELAISVAGPLLALYFMYQLMPSAPVHPLSAIAGAFAAAVLLQGASWLFGLYLTHAIGYEKLYGNLGLIPVFLFWLWINWVIVLVGAEVGYSLQNLDRLTAEERRRHGAPFIHPGLVALGLVLHAARAFHSGKGPVDADDLAESSGLPDRLWLRLVNLLRDRGILVEAGPDGSRFIPGRPLDALPVEEVFAVVEDSLVAQFDEIWHPEQDHLQALSNVLAQSRQKELGKTSIADLLALDGNIQKTNSNSGKQTAAITKSTSPSPAPAISGTAEKGSRKTG